MIKIYDKKIFNTNCEIFIDNENYIFRLNEVKQELKVPKEWFNDAKAQGTDLIYEIINLIKEELKDSLGLTEFEKARKRIQEKIWKEVLKKLKQYYLSLGSESADGSEP